MSGSAKAGTIAERHTCELWVLTIEVVRAFPKRASGGLCFPLTKTYMDVGKPDLTRLLKVCPSLGNNRPDVRSGHISGFDVPEISVVDGVDFNRAE
jgi:hypothetical protein